MLPCGLSCLHTNRIISLFASCSLHLQFRETPLNVVMYIVYLCTQFISHSYTEPNYHAHQVYFLFVLTFYTWIQVRTEEKILTRRSWKTQIRLLGTLQVSLPSCSTGSAAAWLLVCILPQPTVLLNACVSRSKLEALYHQLVGIKHCISKQEYFLTPVVHFFFLFQLQNV